MTDSTFPKSDPVQAAAEALHARTILARRFPGWGSIAEDKQADYLDAARVVVAAVEPLIRERVERETRERIAQMIERGVVAIHTPTAGYNDTIHRLAAAVRSGASE